MKIMVLDDGLTYSSLEGCRIMDVPDDWPVDDIEFLLGQWDSDEAQIEAELTEAEISFETTGGRGVETADRIDLLRAILATSIVRTF